MSTGYGRSDAPQPQVIVQVPPQTGFFRSWVTRLLLAFLMFSVFLNFVLMSAQSDLAGDPLQEYVSGSRTAADRIAIIDIVGTITPPFTERWLKLIEHARDDDQVKAVVLSIDSPGGLVADSHQIYHRIQQLAARKPVYVSMKRIAASGGVYVSMGIGEQGRIFAEPTTWTGSIGVIIPHYDVSGLAEKLGVTSTPLTTGPMKDSMNPFKPLNAQERDVWLEIMDDSFSRFVRIIAENRKTLDEATVRETLATGQVFTASQALKNGLIDGISFEDEVVETLIKDMALSNVKVVRYSNPPTLLDVLMGTAQANDPEVIWRKAMETTVPRAMYYCSWLPAL